MNTPHNDLGAIPSGSKPVGGGRRASRRGLWVGGAVGLIALVGIGLAVAPGRSNGSKEGAADGAPKVAPTLEFTQAEVVRPVVSPMPLAVQFSGPLVAPNTAVVRAKAAGTLLSLKVGEGSRVEAGQLLGEIDLADLQSRVAERSATVESAHAAVVEAERLHTANTSLAGANFISPTVLQSSQAKLDAARAQLKAAKAQLSSMQQGVKEAVLVSPIGGIVGKRHAVPGEKVSAEQQLLTVVDLSALELAGTVGTHEVSLLKPGQAVSIQVEGQSEPVTGHIDRIAPAAEAGTRAIGVVVVVDNHDEHFRGGQYAQAQVLLNDKAPRMNLPSSAVSQASGQDYVWTIENSALTRRVVVTGRRDALSGRIEVVNGLAADAQVLAARFDNLKEGAAAKVSTSKLPAAVNGGSASAAASSSGPTDASAAEAASAPPKS